MKWFPSSALTLCLLSWSGAATAQRPMTVDDVLGLRAVGQVTISPDGEWVAYVVTERDFERNENETEVWVVPTSGGGPPTRLTYHEGTDTSPAWSPDGWLAFRSERDEHTRVYGIDPLGGEAWPVTAEGMSIDAFAFSPDGSHLAFTGREESTEEDEALEEVQGRPIVWDSSYADQWSRLWMASLQERQAHEPERQSPDSLHVTRFVWGPDSRSLAFGARPSPILRTSRLGSVFVLDERGANARAVTAMPGGESPVAWTDAGLIVSGSGQPLGTYNSQLWLVASSGGDPTSLTQSLDENAQFVAFTDHALIVEASHRTQRGLYRLEPPGSGDAGPMLISDDAMFYSRFSASKDGARVAFLAESESAPADVYVATVASFAPRKLSDHNPQVKQFALGEQRVVRWESRADGEEIEGVLTLPTDHREGERVPLLLVIHGGPSGVSSNRFSTTRGAYPIQVFAGLGFAVLQPNYRGSTGYGERFRGLNRGDISGRDWIDIDSGVDEMVRRGLADPERLGVSGWSFGGHHTYWGITQTDRFVAASAGAGANDLISMYSQTDIPEFYHTYLGPKPWEDFELYEQRSAYRFVERVTTPLLIQVGERDERVPAEQSIQFYEAVKAIGKAPTKLVVYPGQPHGVREPRLVRDLMSRNVEWFSRWIPIDRSVSPAGH